MDGWMCYWSIIEFPGFMHEQTMHHRLISVNMIHSTHAHPSEFCPFAKLESFHDTWCNYYKCMRPMVYTHPLISNWRASKGQLNVPFFVDSCLGASIWMAQNDLIFRARRSCATASASNENSLGLHFVRQQKNPSDGSMVLLKFIIIMR